MGTLRDETLPEPTARRDASRSSVRLRTASAWAAPRGPGVLERARDPTSSFERYVTRGPRARVRQHLDRFSHLTDDVCPVLPGEERIRHSRTLAVHARRGLQPEPGLGVEEMSGDPFVVAAERGEHGASRGPIALWE